MVFGLNPNTHKGKGKAKESYASGAQGSSASDGSAELEYMFPDVEPETIRELLREHKGDLDATVEELLGHSSPAPAYSPSSSGYASASRGYASGSGFHRGGDFGEIMEEDVYDPYDPYSKSPDGEDNYEDYSSFNFNEDAMLDEDYALALRMQEEEDMAGFAAQLPHSSAGGGGGWGGGGGGGGGVDESWSELHELASQNQAAEKWEKALNGVDKSNRDMLAPIGTQYGQATWKDAWKRKKLGTTGNLFLSGEATVGSTLTASSPQLAGMKCKFQWQRVYLDDDTTDVKAVNVPKATKPTYLVTEADLGYRVRVMAAPIMVSRSGKKCYGEMLVEVTEEVKDWANDEAVPHINDHPPRRAAKTESVQDSRLDMMVDLDLMAEEEEGRIAWADTAAAAKSKQDRRGAPSLLPSKAQRQPSKVPGGSSGPTTPNKSVPVRQLRRLVSVAASADDNKDRNATVVVKQKVKEKKKKVIYVEASDSEEDVEYIRAPSRAPARQHAVHPGAPPGAPPPPPPPPPPPLPGGIPRPPPPPPRPKLKKNADGTWEQVTVPTSKEERGPKASAKVKPKEASVQDKMLAEMRTRLSMRKGLDTEKLAMLENKVARMMTPTKPEDPAATAAPASPQSAGGSELKAAPSDVIARARSLKAASPAVNEPARASPLSREARSQSLPSAAKDLSAAFQAEELKPAGTTAAAPAGAAPTEATPADVKGKKKGLFGLFGRQRGKA